MHTRYQEWIRYVFDHPVSDRPWYFNINAPVFEATQADYAQLICETFVRSGQDLREFTDAQVNQGIWFLASPSGSDFIFSLRDGDISVSQKVKGIRSIYDLYRNCFANRCTGTLAHIDEPGASELNSICYMFWDVCPLSYLDEANDKAALEDAVFSVLEDTIRLPHGACIEAGLHGLGEMASSYEHRVKEVINRFVRTARLDAALREYAEHAREGSICERSRIR
ncbi:MAG TPA: hypothetical protein VEH04_01640 [Verrucomicrobiae bacterium]|nr:hypothetical protein [Verrucomicrobiae bacterium]